MSLPTTLNAFITLLTTPSYLPGALVLLHSILDLHPPPRHFKTVCLVTPETVDARSIGELRKAGWDLVIGVEGIGSGVSGENGLNLMGRPDLNLALTKLHLFRLHTLFSTLIYLDADVLPLRPLSHLFTTTSPHVLSACPDTGWPDCFNSGVMVIRPRESDWEGLRGLLRNGEGPDGIYAGEGSDGAGVGGLSGNGSFDGADQGLLNEWFSEEGGGGPWNRLSFTYNVTPTAAYQYKPAYLRYGHKINAVHFIGPNKPWAGLANRPAGMSMEKTGREAYEYPALIDKWYAVYDRRIRPTNAHHPDLAKRFAVPEYVAVWNVGAGIPSQPDDRLDLNQLKAAVDLGLTAIKPGQYMSLPLDGRIDLIMPSPKPRVSFLDPAPPSPPAVSSPLHVHAPPPQTIEQQTTQPATWDASKYSPPKSGGPEMVTPIRTHYAPAWDQRPSQRATYYSQSLSTDHGHQPEPQYPTLPKSVTNDSWYQAYSGLKPDPKQIQPVFPWEQSGGEHRKPDRVFPRGSSPPPRYPVTHSVPTQRPKPQLLSPRASTHTPPPPPARSMAESMASYTNAWDTMPQIRHYVDRITGRRNVSPGSRNINRSKEINHGLQSVPGSPHWEKSGFRSGGGGGDRDRDRDTSSSLERRSNASGDGDDEEEEESDVNEDGSEKLGGMSSRQGSLGMTGMGQGQARGSRMGMGQRYPSNENYRDRNTQTDRPIVHDAKVQAVSETGGPGEVMLSSVSRTTLGIVGRRGAGYNRQSSSETAKAHDSPPSGTARYQLGGGKGGVGNGHGQGNGNRVGSPVPPVQPRQASRTFDPSTDIEVRKRNTQEVLSRFLKVGFEGGGR